jgi:hypothetical protein
MKPYKADHTHGDTIEARKFNHGERSMKIRRVMLKKATRKFLRDLDKSEN